MKKSRLFVIVCLVFCMTACGSEENDSAAMNSVETISQQSESTLTEDSNTEEKTEAESEPQKASDAEEDKPNAGNLKGYLNLMKNQNFEKYANADVLDAPIQAAEEILLKEDATQEDYDNALAAIRNARATLHDGSGYPAPEVLGASEAYPDVMTFLDGTKVANAEDWQRRMDEMRGMYEYYMYGVTRDSAEEVLTYTYTDKSVKLTIEHEGNKGSFDVTVSLPDPAKVEMPEGGWPVIMALGWFFQTEYANDRGYAVMTFDYSKVAADDSSHKGAFYDVYPYGKTWEEQTGALAAWGWGFSKIIDALEQGLGEVYHINPEHTIVTGVSRLGKATAVAGAFDTRIKIAAPSCSGAGGMAMYRYVSEGDTYDLSAIGAPAQYTYGQNEPLSSLQSGAERHWFNDNFRKFTNVNMLPVDQHMLASLYAGQDRYLFIISSYIHEDWTNPPAMWETYKEAKKIFSELEEEEHIAFQIHKEGHAVIDEDVVLLLDYADKHLYGKESKSDLSKLDTCLFE